MRLREIMSTRVVTIEPREAASLAWSRMQQQRIRHLVVTENARLVGVVSERDLGGRKGADIRKGRIVQDLMTARVVSAEPKTTLRQAANLMRGRRIGCLPVFEGDRMVGIVTATDVLDELGRGSTRPTILAERPTLRLPANSKQLGGRPIVRRHPRASRKKTRGRPREADSKKRRPLASILDKAFKREPRGKDASLIPAHIRLFGVELDEEDQRYIRRKLGMKLGKFATSIERVSVRVGDVNGPRGGVDQVCRIKVVLSARPSVIFERRGTSIQAAIDGALGGAERAVRRSCSAGARNPSKRQRG